MKNRVSLISIAILAGLTLSLSWILGNQRTTVVGAPAAPNTPTAELQVCPSDCMYSSIQAAVDAAVPGDIIKVASDIYTDIHARAGISQVVYISKTVTIRGGYTNAFTEPPDPEANPTTLDAGGSGRVLYVTGDVSPTVEGLRITGGDATGLGGGEFSWQDAGGGVYVITASAVISNNYIFGNTLNSFSDQGRGGGVYLNHSNATLNGNVISNNSSNGYYGRGGGLYLDNSPAILSDNIINDNTVGTTMNEGQGGGLYLFNSNATLSGNTISGNTASGFYNNNGGGLYLYNSAAQLIGNTIISNTSDSGGGLYLSNSDATLSGNTVSSNTANYDGGGLYLYSSQTLNPLYMLGSGANLINNVIADNHALGVGSGIYIGVGGSTPRLWHTTIARNTGGDGSGVYMDFYGTLTLTNTILISQTVGITVTAGNVAILDGVLWYSNTTNTGGAGTITVTNAYTGTPAFASDGYHLTASSAAINRGASAGVTTDIDGQLRDAAPDLGADEYRTCWVRLNNDSTDFATVQTAVAHAAEVIEIARVSGVKVVGEGVAIIVPQSQAYFITNLEAIRPIDHQPRLAAACRLGYLGQRLVVPSAPGPDDAAR
ncbi:MAG: right-handed parallel beta-helix repeat-containing protein, partial [Anaerolineae bacterium]